METILKALSCCSDFTKVNNHISMSTLKNKYRAEATNGKDQFDHRNDILKNLKAIQEGKPELTDASYSGTDSHNTTTTKATNSNQKKVTFESAFTGVGDHQTLTKLIK